jgi:hypothetical protein
MGGLVGFPTLAPYAATKFAVVGLSDALRAELADEGIGVSVRCPGGVRSRLWRTSRAVRGLPDTDVPPDDMSAQSASAGMEPYEVGTRVVDAIIADEPFILTHPEMWAVTHGGQQSEPARPPDLARQGEALGHRGLRGYPLAVAADHDPAVDVAVMTFAAAEPSPRAAVVPITPKVPWACAGADTSVAAKKAACLQRRSRG